MSSSPEPRRWTVLALLEAGTDVLGRTDDRRVARLESEVLLAHVLGVERIDLYMRHDMPISDEHRSAFRALIKRRLDHEPVAYITGRRDFLDWTFEVDPAVLIPRPETEHAVQATCQVLGDVPTRLLEIGVGSGCWTISVLLSRPQATAVAVDLSRDALEVARRNAGRLGVADRVRFVNADGFTALRETTGFDAIVSNPPYITEGERESLAVDVVRFEPELALFSPTDDALAWHRRIVREAPSRLREGGRVVLELPAAGGRSMKDEAVAAGFSAGEVVHDLAGHERVFVSGPLRSD